MNLAYSFFPMYKLVYELDALDCSSVQIRPDVTDLE